jgi:hypothetical protein
MDKRLLEIRALKMGKQKDNLHIASPRQTIFMKLVWALMFLKVLCHNHGRYSGPYFSCKAFHRHMWAQLELSLFFGDSILIKTQHISINFYTNRHKRKSALCTASKIGFYSELHIE